MTIYFEFYLLFRILYFFSAPDKVSGKVFMSKLKINMFYTLIYILCNCFRFISPILASYLAQNLYVLYISHSSGICTLEILKNRQTKIKSIENINEFLYFYVICNLIVPIQIFHSHLSKTTTRF